MTAARDSVLDRRSDVFGASSAFPLSESRISVRLLYAAWNEEKNARADISVYAGARLDSESISAGIMYFVACASIVDAIVGSAVPHDSGVFFNNLSLCVSRPSNF